MKISAHPLMVAVALGLLGPGALEDSARRTEATSEITSIDRDEIERAERLWVEARDAFDAETKTDKRS